MSVRDSLLDDLRAMPVVDAHAHVISHDQCQPLESVMELLTGAYLGPVLGFASSKAAAAMQDPSRSDRERWNEFVQVWPAWRCTGYGRVFAGTLNDWDLDADRLTEDMYPAVLDRVRARSPESSRRAYAQAGIEASITHYLGHPFVGLGAFETIQSFLDGRLAIERGFFPQLGTLPLHEYPDRGGIETVASIADVHVEDLDSLVAAVREIVRRCAEGGVVGFKDHRAYTQGLSFEVPDRDAAQRDLQELFAGKVFRFGPRALSDYMFDQLVQMAIEYTLPIAIHTGYRQLDIDHEANVVKMTRVFATYPQAVFDLYHLNYPYREDYLATLKSYPNVYANSCWTHIIDPAYTVEFLKSAIGAIPANHVFGFGSDFLHLPEAAVAHLEIARVNIAEAMSWAIDRRMISRHSSLELARMWLNSNPRTVYRLGSQA